MKLLKRIPLWAWPIVGLAAARRAVPAARQPQGDLRRRRRVPPSPDHQAAQGRADRPVHHQAGHLPVAHGRRRLHLRGSHQPRPQDQARPLPGRHGEALRARSRRHRGRGHEGQRRATWFPYIGGAFFFILVCNLIGLIPLPFGVDHQLAFYAATGNINVTITLAVFTFVFTHYAGIHEKGPVGYVKGWVIPAPPVLKQFIFVSDVISEVFRLVSLSVRLFANMLAGHFILAVFFAMVLVFQSYLIGVVLQAARWRCSCSRSSWRPSRRSSSPSFRPSTSARRSNRNTEAVVPRAHSVTW